MMPNSSWSVLWYLWRTRRYWASGLDRLHPLFYYFSNVDVFRPVPYEATELQLNLIGAWRRGSDFNGWQQTQTRSHTQAT